MGTHHVDEDFHRAMNQSSLCPRCGGWYPGGLCPNPDCPSRKKSPSQGVLGRRVAGVGSTPPSQATLPPQPPTAPWGFEPPAAPPPPARRRTALRTLRTVGIVALVIAVGLGAWFGLTKLTSGGSPVAHAVAPIFPATWDARVVPLVDFVEKTRGLTFKHPVFVDFLTPSQYSTSVHVPAPSQADRTDDQRHAGFYRSVGLVSGNVDLAATSNQIADQGTLAYYSHHTKRVDVRGTDLTVGLRVTLVHELTHALQDQHFDLTRIDRMASTGAQTAFQSLFEGDAVRIEEAYAASLTAPERAAYATERNAQKGSADTGLASVPPALVTLFGAPYDLGAMLLAVLEHKNGNAAIDDAFRNPPVDEAQVFDPWVYLANQQPDKVADPATAKGENRFHSGDFGALSWFVTISQRIDPHPALQAADAWAGDRYVAFERNKQVCVRADIDATSAAAGDRLAAAFTQWGQAMPASTAAVTRRGNGIEVNSCDPGTAANLQPIPTAQEALVVPVARTEIALSALKQGATTAQARCAGSAVALAYSEAELADPSEAALSSPAGQIRLHQTVAPCRSVP